MRGWLHLWRVRIQRCIIDVEDEVDRAAEPKVLRVVSDLSVRKKEHSTDESTDDHRVLATQPRIAPV